MRYVIQRKSDNKYLKNFESLFEIETSEWIDDISESKKIPGGICDAIIFRFKHVNYPDDFEKIKIH